MRLLLQRELTANGATLGTLYVDGHWAGFTLEDPVRELPGRPVEEWKIPKQTAIPAGTYAVTLFPSPHFSRVVPRLHDVPGFTDIELHIGNTPVDTDGCILVGLRRSGASIEDSRLALDQLVPAIAAAVDRGEPVTITVANFPA